MCNYFQAKQTTLIFPAQNCPKTNWESQIQKTNDGLRINIIMMPYVPILGGNRQLWIFRPKFAQKWILGLEFRKSKSGSRISTSKIPWTPTFSQKNNIEFFGLNLGKLLDYMWHFGSNMLRVLQKAGWTLKWAGWRWMELGVDGWSWVELGGAGRMVQQCPFKKCCPIISKVVWFYVT